MWIYRHVLCRLDSRPLPKTWCARGPKGCTNLLRCNRQIADEARNVLYRYGTCTMDISSCMVHHGDCEYSRSKVRFREFPTLSSSGQVKHWQFDLQFQGRYSDTQPVLPGYRYIHTYRTDIHQQKCRMDRVYMREGILETAARLAKIEHLQSLKIKFPCRCQPHNSKGHIMHVGFSELEPKGRSRSIHAIFRPLKSLFFQGEICFIAAQPMVDSEDPTRGPCYQTRSIQCQEAGCLAFVARFDELGLFLGSLLPRTRLSPQQRSWLDMKWETLRSRSYGSTISNIMFHLWMLMECNQDVFGWRGNARSQKIRQRVFKAVVGFVREETADKEG